MTVKAHTYYIIFGRPPGGATDRIVYCRTCERGKLAGVEEALVPRQLD